jgi:hypothetical protein
LRPAASSDFCDELCVACTHISGLQNNDLCHLVNHNHVRLTESLI